MILRFFVPGRPIAQGSLNPFVLPGIKKVLAAIWYKRDFDLVYRTISKYIVVPQKPKVKKWRNIIKDAALNAISKKQFKKISDKEPVQVSLIFYFNRPKSHYGTGKNSTVLKDSAQPAPTGRNIGDIDKLERSVLDALSGIAYDDDSQVCSVHKMKMWGSGSEGVWINVMKGSKV
jgi:Holliday junction resolvase RusA-like endonuclease